MNTMKLLESIERDLNRIQSTLDRFRKEKAQRVIRKVSFDEFISECSTRLVHCIKNNDCKNMADIIQMPSYDWIKTPNFGKQCLEELEENLLKFGLVLIDRE